MSIYLLTNPILALFLASLTRDLYHALAFHRTHPGRALGAPKACVWHARAPEPPRLASHPFWPWATTASMPRILLHRHATPTTPGTLQHRRHGTLGGTPASAVRLCHGWCRPSHPGSPPAPGSCASLSPRSSASSRRLHVALPHRMAVRHHPYHRPPWDRPPPPI